MSPLEIEIALHYHYSAADFRNGDFSAPAVAVAIERFAGELGLLRPAERRRFELTERGRVYVAMLCALEPPPFCAAEDRAFAGWLATKLW